MWRRVPHSAVCIVGVAGLLLGACGNGSIGTESEREPTPLPAGPGVSTLDQNGTTTTVYDDGTIVVEHTDGTKTVTDPNGVTTVYDANGNIVSQTDDTQGNPANPETVLDPGDTILQVPEDDLTAPEPGGGIDLNASLAAFEQTVYPLLRGNCSTCHSSDTVGQLPLHADLDVEQAHTYALSFVNLRQPASSRLISRLGIDGHNCWSGDCAADATVMGQEVQGWADLLGDGIDPTTGNVYDGQLAPEVVGQWVAADLAVQRLEDQPYLRYASLHELHNHGMTLDDLNLARAGLSKALNSTARYAPEIVNPIAIDDYSLVYRFDVRDYWGYARATSGFGGQSSGSCLSGGGFGFGGGGTIEQRPECGLEIWDRIALGNTEVSQDDTTWSELGGPANNEGFSRYAALNFVEAAQLVYTLSRPDVYNAVMQIPGIATPLESALGVDTTQTYQFMTVNDAITIGERLMWRAPIPDGYYWKSVDQFSTVDFVFYERPIPVFTSNDNSQIITTPVLSDAEGGPSTPNEYTGDTGAQAQASEVIFSMPNGLQGYAIFGAGNQRRTDAFTFVVVDPRRIGEMPGIQPSTDQRFNFNGVRLLNGASCMGCHASGMNRAPDDMRSYIAANPDGSWTQYATRQQVEALYPGTEAMEPIIEADRTFFLNAQQKIANEMIVGTTDKTLYFEPQLFMFEAAQRIYGYINTISN